MNLFTFNKYFRNFYHEYSVPDNHFFRNKFSKFKPLIISSPSRMGNHLLHSKLDSHPELPRIPGEDGNLFHYFKFASQDINNFFNLINKKNIAESLERFAATGGNFAKWYNFDLCYRKKVIPKVWSGIQYPTDSPYITDYKKILFEINYADYHNELKKANKLNFKSILELTEFYYKCLLRLDPKFKKKNYYKYDSIIFSSGMRSMSRYILKNCKKAKLISTIRKFDSYAFSHIKSRYKSIRVNKYKLQEAWEHWFHKITDYIILKQEFPNRVLLLNFDDVISNSIKVNNAITSFLEISYHDSLNKPTAFGNPVKGNSSNRSNKSNIKEFYNREAKILNTYKYYPKYVDDYENLIKKFFYKF